MNSFADWLRNELKDRNWTQAKLSEESFITPPTISRIINSTRGPGPEICNKLAKAFNLPSEYVFRKAGILPENPNHETDPQLAEANQLLSELPDEYKKQALNLIRFLHSNHVNHAPNQANSTPH